ncbi:chloride channel protein CLC-f-like isoform X1 [Cynara cardunculus var. scolymus]|uniref:chloride channel protein CLC-f-like isoform X1 n=1 Tax=Cynara cardunculus var. scolymus TaxID=59895 RepID=UPI000D627979|nr:chloride channel protein CLC-f-like isoform X1 [Cynara cardunculus var. scolymus]
MSGGDRNDHAVPLRSSSSSSGDDLEGQVSSVRSSKGIKDLWNKLDRRFSGRRLSIKRRLPKGNRSDFDYATASRSGGGGVVAGGDETLGDGAPPEWALLLIGCLLGLATGLCVAAFNRGVHVIHEWSWAGTPNEGAAWLRLQRLGDTWHRILLIPVTGGVIVGVLHGLLEILHQIKQSNPGHDFNLLSGVFPTVKAIQAAVTLGTGCSLGPEGPSVDIGKSCANGFSLMMENNKERRVALVAAGAAAGISSGFNAAVAGCFFAIETVLRPQCAENSPPFTTAMIILASVISSTVSSVILGEKQAFTVPSYDLKSAAELPLYLILGMLCGVVSVLFTRLVAWFNSAFAYIEETFGLPAIVSPALGGLGAGLIALKYPGILYWGFTNIDEILHTGKTASAPGIWLLAQLAAAKVVATALCKGSGLVGGLYAPSLMIGAAVGAVFGGSAGKLINSAISGNAAIAQPQAYALVGMAATLASVCSVPLTSVLLLFELTKDYRILLPLMGAVGLAIWVPSVANQSKEAEGSDTRSSSRGYSFLSPIDDKTDDWRQNGEDDLELCIMGPGDSHEAIDEDIILEDLKVSQAMTNSYPKVLLSSTVNEAVKSMNDGQQSCVLVVDHEDHLEGILTYGDVKRGILRTPNGSSDSGSSTSDLSEYLVSSICTRGINYRGRKRGLLTCYPDTDLAIAKKLMEAKEIKQLPVVQHVVDFQEERKRRVVAILYYHSIWSCLREELNRRGTWRTEDHIEEKSCNGQ